MTRPLVAATAASFALDALADDPLLSILTGLAVALVALWALMPERSR